MKFTTLDIVFNLEKEDSPGAVGGNMASLDV